MARIFVTGSADGLGRATAQSLLLDGHEVVAHARNPQRAESMGWFTQRGADVLIADLSVRAQILELAHQLLGIGPLDAVVHNAGVISGRTLMPVNVVAPYLLTALLRDVPRHVYLSSGMHRGGSSSLDGIDWEGRRASGSYADSKLFVTALSAAAARIRPAVMSNAVDPGWVATKMGGAGAPDDFAQGHQTQEWLAAGAAPEAMTSGGYWYHRAPNRTHPAVHDVAFQQRLLESLEAATGVPLTA
ncbi:NAD(P)-dependent dehydrogenase (short-subunit alcohol dehydrogenase family) [Conyzicola lurida]|uniref:NAD(P)-dependent dehydrogenase (Short-subunit alcohol dehydrogenase family) n=1 Tax=Conyzicola lurida TaxID=1172621 RepID=A0A841AHP4_9MICO|nr:SDR family NAD(P)-dependent oxidoreductase [Conyzicola lurida]MBB5843360.1 NAD(P)-dependent dehydrogenase (short-subunit alcohol dehydrogenase family) [Conyzicola lurida]